MRNYEYIIACLPVLQQAAVPGADSHVADLLKAIKEQLNQADNSLVDTLLEGFDTNRLCADFYRKALKCKNSFIRDYFAYDLELRNIKVEYLNSALHRQPDQDIVELNPGEEREEFEGRAEVMAVLETHDILGRERGLDNLLWNKIDELTIHELFSITSILGFIARLQIVDRWEKLDPATGKEYFRRFVEEIRSTYDNKKNTII